MPVMCQYCAATNPPQSSFCHRCGATLCFADGLPNQSPSRIDEPSFRDVAADFKVLAVDVTRFSAPRIRTGAIFTARVIRRSALYGVSGIRTIGAAIATRANRPKQSPDELDPEQGPQPAATSQPMATTLSPTREVPAPEPPPTAEQAIGCPRCRIVNQAGSIFCFNCGLPLDEAAPVARPTPRYTGRPAGIWIRLAAAMIDAVILAAAQLILIAIWVGIPEYIESDSLLHWVDVPLVVMTARYYTIGVSIWSTTVGKRVFALRVLRPDGSKVGPGRALGRYFAGGISFLILGVGYLMIAFRPDKRGLHDVICDTIVLRT